MTIAMRFRAAISAVLLVVAFLAVSCSNDDSPSNNTNNNTPQITYGKIRYTTTVNGDLREYYVHVPLSYDGKTAVPVVFMFHGTSGDGEKFYNISGWKEKGEQENIITVFPSSWHYCFTEDGETKNNTKWNGFTLVDILCPGETPRDDVKFVDQMMTELKAKYNIDAKRIYATGFSNGGQFTARLAVELSDKLAAVASNSGGIDPGATYTPKRLLPISYMLGNIDDRYTALNNNQPLPMDMDSLFAVPYIRGVVGTYALTFGLDTTYTLSGVPGVAPIATFTGTSGKPENLLHFTIVKNMPHIYPNGENFALSCPEKLWDFFKQYSLP